MVFAVNVILRFISEKMKPFLLSFVGFLLIHKVFCYSYPRNVKELLNLADDPDILRNVSQLITSKGYPVEEYTVQTSDGYLLGLQRIPHGKNNAKAVSKEVIFLQHGLLSASSDWVLNYPEQSLGFILADLGYDVWLGNTRGNTYSKRHIKLKPSMIAFWNFSFDQMAEYDLPAMIDFVLNKTEQKQLIYIGHSQGTTSAFALLSQSPIYNKKIKFFVALAPATTVGHVSSIVKYLAPFSDDLDFLYKLIGFRDFLPSNGLMKFLSEKICGSKVKFICEDIMFMVFGYDKKELNETRLPVYAAHTPAGSSSKSVAHYGQLVVSKKFRKFDYGKHNKEHYNQDTPPDYDVSKITTPTAVIWGLNDDLADPTDVKILESKLKSMVSTYCVPFRDFNHGDFVLAIDARKLVYEEVLTLLRKYVN